MKNIQNELRDGILKFEGIEGVIKAQKKRSLLRRIRGNN